MKSLKELNKRGPFNNANEALEELSKICDYKNSVFLIYGKECSFVHCYEVDGKVNVVLYEINGMNSYNIEINSFIRKLKEKEIGFTK